MTCIKAPLSDPRNFYVIDRFDTPFVLFEQGGEHNVRSLRNNDR